MKKRFLFVLLLFFVVPTVLGMSSQQWISYYGLNQPIHPVEVGSNVIMDVYDSSGNLLFTNTPNNLAGNPVVGDELIFSFSDDIVYRKILFSPDNFNYFYNDLLQGSLFYNFPNWLAGIGTSNKINTQAWTPGDYHVIAYTLKYDAQNNQYYDNSWKTYTFTLDAQRKTVNSTIIRNTTLTSSRNISSTKVIGPLSSKNVANCVTPPANLQSAWNVDTDVTLCNPLGNIEYNLVNGVDIVKSGITFDCNGAKIIGTVQAPETIFKIKSSDITIRNCHFFDVELQSRYTSKLLIENNLFDNIHPCWGGQGIKFFVAQDSIIQNNEIRRGALVITGGYSGTTNNKIINNKVNLIIVHATNQNEILNNQLNELILRESSENVIKDNDIIWTSIKMQNPPAGKLCFFYNPEKLLTIEDGDNNIVKNNNLGGQNSAVGVYLTLNSENNGINNNNFLKNLINIEEENDHKNNYERNYFDNHNCTDQNKDNVCDNSYDVVNNQQILVAEDSTPSKIPN